MLSVRQKRGYVPIFGRNERFYFAFFVNDYSERDRLHAPRGKSVLYSFAKKGAELITDESVENSSRLLRIDEIVIYLSRIFQSFFNRSFAYFVELYSLRDIFQAENFLQMPAYRFSLSVRVGCEINFIGFFDLFFKSFDNRLFIRGYNVIGFVVFGYVHAQSLFGQIPDVSAACVHLIFPA